MSWSIAEEHWPIDKIKTELERLKNIEPYPTWLIYLVVPLAGASFCRLFGGDGLAMIITFVSTLFGFFVRQNLISLRFNFYLSVFSASFVSSMITGYFIATQVDSTLDHAFASSILYLVPGIPLINSFSDFIDGNLLNGFLRGLNSLLISFSMTMGWLLTVSIYNI